MQAEALDMGLPFRRLRGASAIRPDATYGLNLMALEAGRTGLETCFGILTTRSPSLAKGCSLSVGVRSAVSLPVSRASFSAAVLVCVPSLSARADENGRSVRLLALIAPAMNRCAALAAWSP